MITTPPGIPVSAAPERGTIRREVRIARSAAEVWSVVGDPSTIHRWFPGMADSAVDGSTRLITTGSGIPLPEEILTVDHLLRRFQYRVAGPMLRHHQGTIDVHELGEQECLVVYATDAEPRAMTLVIGGATGAALLELKRQLEAGELDDLIDADADADPATTERERTA
jgi:hypothetical protein